MLSTINVPIHIVEPTLRDEAGHCHSLIANLAACQNRPPLVVWGDKQIHLPQLTSLPRLKLNAYFSRRLRRLQAYFLYRCLLKQPGKIFISTAGRTDMQLMHWAAGNTTPKNKVYFYVHWLSLSAEKKRQLKKMAQHRPEFNLLTTTDTAADNLRECGFLSAKQIPYPVAATAASSQHSFKYVLIAGAARQDKGLSQVIDYIEFLRKSNSTIPVSIQTSAEHYGKVDITARAEINRLDSILYAPLIRQRETLSADAYRALYDGAICLQPYDPLDFADRVSGVTLDALRAGAPVITTDHTWMANIVKRFDAGVVLQDRSAPSIHSAVETIRARFNDYQSNAHKASQALESENSAQHLIDALMLAK
jgi:glycosyltransferase involved in cell wall biosynthesis